MKKIHIFTAIVASLVVLVGFVLPSAALAQYYNYATYGNTYPNYVAPTTYTAPVATYGVTGYGMCTNLTSNLYKGLSDVTTGGQVSALQSFLVARGYLASTQLTGSFGASTATAVARYQIDNGIPSDGTVGVRTRTSIQTVSCGNNYGSNYVYNTGYQYGYTNNYGYNSGYQNGYNNYYSSPVASSLSQASGPVGISVTIYGSGFDLYNNTVNFNGVTLVGIPSYNGTALAFAVPQVNNYNNNYNNQNCYNSYSNSNNNCNNSNYYSNSSYNNGTTGTFSVSVTTSRGTSNALNFTVTSGSNYIYGNNNYGCNYDSSHNYNSNYNNNSNYDNCYGGRPYLSSISPSSARTGREITIHGSGFASNGNTVHFGNGGTANLSSSNGTTIYYTIPNSTGPCDVATGSAYCPMYEQAITPGSYPVYVSNRNGQTDTIYFTVY